LITMILIGQFDSPFVRRVGVALALFDFAFEHRPWSVWADADALALINPLRRVPTLILDGGEVLIESGAILDALDEMAGPERAMLPRSGPDRRRGLKVSALATGLGDKAVSLFYESLLHDAPSQAWIDRCHAQITDVLTGLEMDRARSPSPWWLGATISHADIAAACALRLTREAHPGLFDASRWPRLAAHSDTCEAMDAFQAVCQPLTVTMREDG
jgi:glutathione S-transferase